MTVAISSVLVQAANVSSGMTSLQSGSVTASSGSHLLVVFGAVRDARTTADWASGITVSDTRGATWTISALVHYANVGNANQWWDVAVGVAIAPADGNATQVTVSAPSGVTLYSAMLAVHSVTGASGVLAGATGITAGISPSAAIALTLGAAPTTDDLTLFARFWSAGGGSTPSSPTALLSGWTSVSEVLRLWDWAGSLSASARGDSTSTAVACSDPWTGDDSQVFGGAALAIVIRAEGSGPVEPTVVDAPIAATTSGATIASVGVVRGVLLAGEAASPATLAGTRTAEPPLVALADAPSALTPIRLPAALAAVVASGVGAGVGTRISGALGGATGAGSASGEATRVVLGSGAGRAIGLSAGNTGLLATPPVAADAITLSRAEPVRIGLGTVVGASAGASSASKATIVGVLTAGVTLSVSTALSVIPVIGRLIGRVSSVGRVATRLVGVVAGTRLRLSTRSKGPRLQ